MGSNNNQDRGEKAQRRYGTRTKAGAIAMCSMGAVPCEHTWSRLRRTPSRPIANNTLARTLAHDLDLAFDVLCGISLQQHDLDSNLLISTLAAKYRPVGALADPVLEYRLTIPTLRLWAVSRDTAGLNWAM
eukprot:scaffold24893_cov27-Tisochrysis_lutea.AAC.2